MARGGRGSCGRGGSRGSGRGSGSSRLSHRSGGKSFSSSTKSFVSGKIAGQYRAKGYSKARAQHIGNSVVNKMGSTFKSGKGSKRSYAAGKITGYYQSDYGLSRSTSIGNSVAYGKPNGGKRGRQKGITTDYCASASKGVTRPAGSKVNAPRVDGCKSYGKSYKKDYSKRYR